MLYTRYRLRLETSIPEERIGGFSSVHMHHVLQWIEDEDAIVTGATMSALLWKMSRQSLAGETI